MHLRPAQPSLQSVFIYFFYWGELFNFFFPLVCQLRIRFAQMELIWTLFFQFLSPTCNNWVNILWNCKNKQFDLIHCLRKTSDALLGNLKNQIFQISAPRTFLFNSGINDALVQETMYSPKAEEGEENIFIGNIYKYIYIGKKAHSIFTSLKFIG